MYWVYWMVLYRASPDERTFFVISFSMLINFSYIRGRSTETYNENTEVKQQDNWHSSKVESWENSALVGTEAAYRSCSIRDHRPQSRHHCSEASCRSVENHRNALSNITGPFPIRQRIRKTVIIYLVYHPN